MSKAIVTVTGGSGYIASWIIHDLLQEGHEVRTTVRDKSKVEKYKHLLALEEQSPGTLRVYEANLTHEGSFDEAVAGAQIVIHTASPFFLDDKNDPQKKLIDPAVEGTKNVLNAVNKSETVTRVVLTSSLAAIYGDNQDLHNSRMGALNEEMWNTTSTLKHNAYSLSKTEAEKVAWAMEKEQLRWRLVTIHPGFVLGPSLTTRKDSTSIETLLRMLRGDISMGAPELSFIYSDVRDVARGHVLAAFSLEAKGRYIIANEAGDLLDLSRIIEKNYPAQYKLPKRYVAKWILWIIAPTIGFSRTYVTKNVGYPLVCDHSKSVKDLKIQYIPLEKTVVDHIEQLKRDKLI